MVNDTLIFLNDIYDCNEMNRRFNG